MDFHSRKREDERPDTDAPLRVAGVLLKAAVCALLLGVGLKLTFWAVGIVEEVLYRPGEVALLKPLLEPGSVERALNIERTDNGVIIRDENGLPLFFLVTILIVVFSAVGRAIAALFGGAVRLIASIDFGRGRS